jgi:hypothetical protein
MFKIVPDVPYARTLHDIFLPFSQELYHHTMEVVHPNIHEVPPSLETCWQIGVNRMKAAMNRSRARL